jgi:hypothetical protein
MKDDLILLDEVGGLPAAQILAEFLKAQGIEVMLAQESVGSSVFPVTFGRLGMVRLWVRAEQYDEATRLLEQVDADQFVDAASTQDDTEITADSENDQGKDL